MKRFRINKAPKAEPRAPGAVLFEGHNPSECFVKWAKYGKPCEHCTWPDDRKKGPFSLDEQARRADSMVGRKGVIRSYVPGSEGSVAHVPPIEGFDTEFFNGSEIKNVGEN